MSEFTYDRQVEEERAARSRRATVPAAAAAGLTEDELARAVTRGVFAGMVRVMILFLGLAGLVALAGYAVSR